MVDVSCGGGTYVHAWAQLGAAEAIGVDFSEPMVQAAAERFQGVAQLTIRIQQVHRGEAIVEQDRWTLWWAMRA